MLNKEICVNNIFSKTIIASIVISSLFGCGGDSSNGSSSNSNNQPPISDAGIDIQVETGMIVTLDASLSSDKDNDTLSYQWSLTNIPEGSNAVLNDLTVISPTFTADIEGSYVAQLIVNDGTENSNIDTVSIVSITVSSISIVDATSVGENMKGLELTDKKGNIITTYVSDSLPDDAVGIKDGMELGAPAGYEIITNEFIELTYSDAVVNDQRQTIRITHIGDFNTVMIFDTHEKEMTRTPYLILDDGRVEFRATPIDGKITFSLINITE